MAKKRDIRSRLERQIITDSPQIARDDASDFVEAFMKDLKTLGPIEKIDLSTPESAKLALSSLAITQAKIERQLKTAQALKRLLTER